MSIYTMGIDVGSTASKCVILKDGSEIVAKSLVAVGTGTSGPSRAIAQVLENAGMTREQMDFVLATGYGRNSLDGLADMQMSELSCHAKGAAFLFPNVRTVVDIGGQDVKVIEIENGMMKNFVMNDKCAAGTGRFLDVMARVLEVKVELIPTSLATSRPRWSVSARPARSLPRARSSRSSPWARTSATSSTASTSPSRAAFPASATASVCATTW